MAAITNVLFFPLNPESSNFWEWFLFILVSLRTYLLTYPLCPRWDIRLRQSTSSPCAAYLVVLGKLACLYDPDSYTTGARPPAGTIKSVRYLWKSLEKNSAPGSSGWGLAVLPTTPPRKKNSTKSCHVVLCFSLDWTIPGWYNIPLENL